MNQGQRYDLIAQGFANMRTDFNTEKKYLDTLISYLEPQATILDIGCGSGCPIAAYFIDQGFKVTGVDGSKELLKIAQTKYPKLNCRYGDIRTIYIKEQYDAIVEWWCLFHLPLEDHAIMFTRFASWLKKGGMLEFTSGDRVHSSSDSVMLNQELDFYSHAPSFYESCLKKNGFKLLLKETDQDEHLVWIAKKE